MRFEEPLIPGILLRRYKRFLADVALDTGETITVYCPNTGRMTTCAEPGWQVLLSDSHNVTRKHRYTWELVHNGTCWIGVNTGRSNKISAEGIAAGKVPELAAYPEMAFERPYGQNSRIDILLSSPLQRCYVEVKNVTLIDDEGFFTFPDAVTARGSKHLGELARMCQEGHRAVVFYLLQRSDGHRFRPAALIDPVYAKGCHDAAAAGVEMLAYRAEVTPHEIALAEAIEVEL